MMTRLATDKSSETSRHRKEVGESKVSPKLMNESILDKPTGNLDMSIEECGENVKTG